MHAAQYGCRLLRPTVADWLRSRGVNVESYTGETGARRAELEQALLDNRVKALVATTALGMRRWKYKPWGGGHVLIYGLRRTRKP